MSTRLTKARIRKWDKQIHDINRSLAVMQLDVSSFTTNAKARRYSKLVEICKNIEFMRTSGDAVNDSVIDLGEVEGVFD